MLDKEIFALAVSLLIGFILLIMGVMYFLWCEKQNKQGFLKIKKSWMEPDVFKIIKKDEEPEIFRKIIFHNKFFSFFFIGCGLFFILLVLIFLFNIS